MRKLQEDWCFYLNRQHYSLGTFKMKCCHYPLGPRDTVVLMKGLCLSETCQSRIGSITYIYIRMSHYKDSTKLALGYLTLTDM